MLQDIFLGGHFNPAVSFGLLAGGRFPAKDLVPYILPQCVGAIAAAAALFTINGGAGDGSAGAFATTFMNLQYILVKATA